MTTTTIQNSQLCVQVNSHGAELTSMVENQTGYQVLWQADPNVWGRHAPILFPIVGKLKNNSFTHGGNTYQLSQHGFARDSLFQVDEQEENRVTLRLCHNEQTAACFPFQFLLTVSYELENNLLHVRNNVKNTGDQILPASIGAHPGFNMEPDSFIAFEKDEPAGAHYLVEGLSDFSGPGDTSVFQNRHLALKDGLFDRDALIFQNPRSTKWTLHTGTRKITLAARVPYLGIWTKFVQSGFVCIEPWMGIADGVQTDGAISHKEGTTPLRPGTSLDFDYTICVENSLK